MTTTSNYGAGSRLAWLLTTLGVAGTATALVACGDDETESQLQVSDVPEADVKQGTFDDGMTSWVDSGSLTTELVPSFQGGEGQSLRLSGTCADSGGVSGVMSVPRNMSNAALTFEYKGTAPDFLYVSVAGRRVLRVQGDGSNKTGTICLPSWARGLELELRYSMPATKEFESTCNVFQGEPLDPLTPVREFLLDNVEVAENEACDDDNLPSDGHFEKMTNDISFGWAPVVDYPLSPATVEARRVGEAEARNGTGVFVLGSTMNCQEVSSVFHFIVPEEVANAGPVVEFWYRSPAPHDTLSFQAAVGSGQTASTRSFNLSQEWRRGVVCLDREDHGLTQSGRFTVEVSSTSEAPASCGDALPGGEVWLDDVVVRNIEHGCR